MNQRRRKTPWGQIAGMLAAASVTLVCVIQSIDPLEILKRTLIAFAAVALVITILGNLLEVKSKRVTRSYR